MPEVCAHCHDPLQPDEIVVEARERVDTTDDWGDESPIEGVIVFIREAHWTVSNPRDWREERRGHLRKFRPAG
jgi:hypothetical protein